MFKLLKYASPFLLILLLISCANTIYHLRYNSDIRAYQAGFARDSLSIQNWHTLRDPQTQKKITEPDTARRLAEQYNEKNNNNLFHEPKSSMFSQYQAGKYYFEAIDNLKKEAWRPALDKFQESLLYDRDLMFTSDIFYLIALCSDKLQDDATRQSSLNKFKTLSEAVYPYSFYLPVEDSDSVYAELLNDTTHFFADNHFSKNFSAPALKNRLFPGFLPYLYQGAALDIRLGALYHFSTDFYPMIELNLGVFRDWVFSGGYAVNPNSVHRYLGFAYQLYRKKDNRIGTVIAVYNSNISSKDYISTDFTYNQYSAVLETGCFLHPRLGIFAGCAYYYKDQEINDAELNTNIFYHPWLKNNLYAGTTFYFTEFIGITLLTGRQQLLKFGVRFGGGHLFLY
jgi:hypothetical protein